MVEARRYASVGDERSSICITLDSASAVPKCASSVGSSTRWRLPRKPNCHDSPRRLSTPSAVCAVVGELLCCGTPVIDVICPRMRGVLSTGASVAICDCSSRRTLSMSRRTSGGSDARSSQIVWLASRPAVFSFFSARATRCLSFVGTTIAIAGRKPDFTAMIL